MAFNGTISNSWDVVAVPFFYMVPLQLAGGKLRSHFEPEAFLRIVSIVCISWAWSAWILAQMGI